MQASFETNGLLSVSHFRKKTGFSYLDGCFKMIDCEYSSHLHSHILLLVKTLAGCPVPLKAALQGWLWGSCTSRNLPRLWLSSGGPSRLCFSGSPSGLPLPHRFSSQRLHLCLLLQWAPALPACGYCPHCSTTSPPFLLPARSGVAVLLSFAAWTSVAA